MKKTILYDCHLENKAQITDFGGFQMPVRYEGDKIEHMAVREKVGIFDVSHMGEVFISGPTAEADINRLLTNDVSKIINGQAFYAAMLNHNGEIIDDVVTYKFGPEKFMICVNASNREKDFLWIKKQIPYAVDESDQWSQIAVQGPKAAELIRKFCAASDVDNLKRYYFKTIKLNIDDSINSEAIVARTGYTGEDGFELYIDNKHAAFLWNALLKKGADLGVKPCGLAARDTLRLEAGMCLYGNDIDETVTPLQAGLSWIVKLGKSTPFIGQEALLAKKNAGLDKKLCGLEITGKGIARHGYKVLSKQHEEIGIVTSGTLTPFLNRAIALAYIQKPFFEPGTEVDIDVRGRHISAKVVSLPFYRLPR